MNSAAAPPRRGTPGLGILLAVAAAGLVGVGAAAFVVVLLVAPQAAGWTALAWTVAAVPALAGIGVVGWAVLERRGLAAAITADSIEGAFETQQRLLDDVRHELKTPITIVRGHLEMMDAADSDDVESIRALGIAELDRMTRLIGDIDVLAAVEGGRLSRGDVDLAALTQRVFEMVGVIGDHAWRVEQSADAVIRADGDRLLQAWVALADNAAKYSPTGTAIEIGSAVNAAGAQLWVRDHGLGIPPAVRHRIFRRFDRGAGKRHIGGSGLGLAIVDVIAKAHGGHCTVADTPGGGATFTLEIPIGTRGALPSPIRAGDVLLQREATE
ncbi:Signal transduction histidine kinase [Microbacterium sp. LKL04]|uniref:sensor histidine kinase n=1 Tax=Microbacterium sp. LKL04 TaxID=912630 RepID=UPI000875DF57|nr:HAMP domain-containing sensor histidine kinase [Microbacterium sp. LKL04]SCY29434.1 Signal transduction histidine kinase [Microbacterium sp. LKL04]